MSKGSKQRAGMSNCKVGLDQMARHRRENRCRKGQDVLIDGGVQPRSKSGVKWTDPALPCRLRLRLRFRGAWLDGSRSGGEDNDGVWIRTGIWDLSISFPIAKCFEALGLVFVLLPGSGFVWYS